MAKFISVFGKRYEVISFLFFLKDWEQFMQVRSTHFQKAFSMLGVRWNGEAPKLVAQCSWDNYAAFNETLSIVRDYLLDEGIPERSTDRCTLLLLGLILPDARRGRYKAPVIPRFSSSPRFCVRASFSVLYGRASRRPESRTPHVVDSLPARDIWWTTTSKQAVATANTTRFMLLSSTWLSILFTSVTSIRQSHASSWSLSWRNTQCCANGQPGSQSQRFCG